MGDYYDICQDTKPTNYGFIGVGRCVGCCSTSKGTSYKDTNGKYRAWDESGRNKTGQKSPWIVTVRKNHSHTRFTIIVEITRPLALPWLVLRGLGYS